MTEVTFRRQLPQVRPMNLPASFAELYNELGLRPDSVGLKIFGDLKLPEKISYGQSARPRIYYTDTPYVLKDLCSHHMTLNVMPMRLQQALAFVVDEVKKPYDAGAYTLWVPFKITDDEYGMMRLYRRKNGTVELFLYSVKDSDIWAEGEDYRVAYHYW